jgi:hypothetical protein
MFLSLIDYKKIWRLSWKTSPKRQDVSSKTGFAGWLDQYRL